MITHAHTILKKPFIVVGFTALVSSCFDGAANIDYALYSGENKNTSHAISLSETNGVISISWKNDFITNISIAPKNCLDNTDNCYIDIFENYDTQSLSCSVDASYVEMTCSKNDLTTKAVDITSIYDEIPSEFRVVIWFQTDSGAFPTSYRILLD